MTSVRLNPIEQQVYDQYWRNAGLTRLAMASRFVLDEPPVSIMLLGPQGAGKTHILEALAEDDRFRNVTDLTQMGLLQHFIDAREGHVLGLSVNDFGTLVNKGQAVAQRAITWLAAGMEEGATRFDRGGDHYFEFPNTRIGLYTAMTLQDFDFHSRMLSSNAFLSRLVLVNHRFASSQAPVFHRLVRDKLLWVKNPVLLPWAEGLVPRAVDDYPGDYDGLVESLVRAVVVRSADSFAFERTYKIFSTLLKASAVLHGRTQVTDEDAHTLDRFRSVWERPPFVPVRKQGAGSRS